MSAETSGEPIDRARSHVCATAASRWLWHCDNHGTHGNADSQDEAEVYAEAHHEYFARQRAGAPCPVVVWLHTPHESADDAAAQLFSGVQLAG
jgi:hypothetical protein